MDETDQDELPVAMAMVTTALMINAEEGEESADYLSHLTLQTAFDNRDNPPYGAQVMAFLASYASVLLQMLSELTEQSPSELHQTMALAMNTEETA